MRRLITYLLVLLVSVPAWSQGRERLEACFIDAVQDYGNEDFDSARAKLQAIIEVDSTFDAAYYYMSLCDYYSGDALSASRNIKKAKALDPGNEWYSQLTEFFRIPSLLDEAEQCRLARDYDGFFEKMTVFAADRDVRTEPKCQYLTSVFGSFDTRIYDGYKAQIERLIDSLIDSDPAASATHHLAMQVYLLYGENDRVIRECEKLIAINASDSKAVVSYLSIIGDLYSEGGQKKEAYKIYDRILSIVPDYAPTLNNYAYFLSLDGKKLKKALEMSRKTIEQEPDNPTYLDTYGWILHLLGRDAAAKPYFKHAMLYGGKDSDVVLEHYAVVLDALGEKDIASFYRSLIKDK